MNNRIRIDDTFSTFTSYCIHDSAFKYERNPD